MAAITQPRWGIFGQRYGSFADKEATVARFEEVAKTTTLHLTAASTATAYLTSAKAAVSNPTAAKTTRI